MKINILKDIEEKQPTDPFVKYAIALEYEKMGELEQAYAYFEKLIVDFADYLPTYLLYGNFLEKIGEEEKAKNIYENGMLLAQKQNNSKAMQEIERALFLL